MVTSDITPFIASVHVVFIDALILLVCSLVVDAVIMGHILRYYYEFYRTQWEHDGRPQGVVWVAPESRAAKQYKVIWQADKAMEWCFSTPWWMSAEPEMRRWLRYHRWVMLVEGLSILAAVAVVIILYFE